MAQGRRIIRVVPEVLDDPRQRIQTIETAAECADPERPLGILIDGPDGVRCQTARVLGVVMNRQQYVIPEFSD